jgi:hypothetical protein
MQTPERAYPLRDSVAKPHFLHVVDHDEDGRQRVEWHTLDSAQTRDIIQQGPLCTRYLGHADDPTPSMRAPRAFSPPPTPRLRTLTQKD